MEGDALAKAGKHADPRGLFQIADCPSRRMKSTPRALRRAAEPCADKSAGFASVSGAHSALFAFPDIGI